MKSIILCALVLIQALIHGVKDDDFCDDTRNGSDETFSSACSGYVGRSTVTCVDTKFVRMNIFSSRLNDGVCDCCDGSDEKSGVCGMNTCESLGNALKESKRVYAEERVEGLKSKEIIVKKTAKRFEEMTEAMSRESKEGAILDQSIRELEERLLEQEKFETVEAQAKSDEAAVVFRRAIEILAGGLTKETMIDWIAALTVRSKEEATESITNSLPQGGALGDPSEALVIALEAPSATDGDIKEKSGNSDELIMNIDGVPVVGPASYVLAKAKLSQSVMQDMKEALALTPENDQSVFVNTLAAAIQEGQVIEVVLLSALDANAFPDLSLSQIRTIIFNIPDSPLLVKKRGIKSAQGNALREELLVNKNKREALKKLAEGAKAIQSTAGQDLGPGNIYLHFFDKCFRKPHGGYQYSACPFKEAYQSNVLLGTFKGIERRAPRQGTGGNQMIDLSDTLKKELGLPTGSSLGGSDSSDGQDMEMWMVFHRGSFCHASGRGRELHVRLECSANEADELVNVMEPETCFYMATLRSPVAC